MQIGYARVSTHDQNLDLQRNALTPGLVQALDFARDGVAQIGLAFRGQRQAPPVAADQADFVRCGVALALDEGTPAMLTALRAGMRQRLLGSAACDSAGLCRSLEAIYLGARD